VILVIALIGSRTTGGRTTSLVLMALAAFVYWIVHRRRVAAEKQRLAAEYQRKAEEEQRKRQLVLSQRLDHLLTLTPREFEMTVADILRRTGFHDVKIVGGAGDLSADITCLDDTERLTIVQCKQYLPSHKVSSPEVQQFIGMAIHHHSAQRMLYVTTSTFSRPAEELCRYHDIEMINGDALTQRAADAQ
jgi:restriction system protein